MNAAIDQQCELYIKEHGLEDKVEAKLKEVYDDKGLPRPVYRADVSEGNNGLGLMYLGLTGDQVLPADVYQQLKAKALVSSRNGTGRYFKRRSGTEYLPFSY
ncbi:MAG: hypothetical protein R2784_13070 [Saprospiraceae bacterium]